jgi:hypothetical protein
MIQGYCGAIDGFSLRGVVMVALNCPRRSGEVDGRARHNSDVGSVIQGPQSLRSLGVLQLNASRSTERLRATERCRPLPLLRAAALTAHLACR